VRGSRGVWLPPVAGGRVRSRTLYRMLRDALVAGALRPGDQLPSSRRAAADYDVSRGMIEVVYAQLADEGFLARGVGRGTFVAAHGVPTAGASRPRSRPPELSARGRRLAANAACREPERARPFHAGVADTSEFPWRLWQRLHARALRDAGGDALRFADPRGLPALRQSIARHLAQFRGIACRPGQVVVFNSAQQALHALAMLLLERGDAVWLEDPCYPGARAALELVGASITPVPVDAHGMRVEDGMRAEPRARLAYVTPSHQYPTGVTMSLERRVALLDWARRRRAWIVEDDYDGEFRYAGQPPTPLASLDPRAPVLVVGTLSKAMFVALRLAYVVVPEGLVEPLANVRTQLDGFTPVAPQLATSLFIDEGWFAPHLRRMRSLYGARHAALVEALQPLRPLGWHWPDVAAGLHLLLRHPDGAAVRRSAAAADLELATLGPYRARRARDDGLFLRFGGLDVPAIRAGAAELVRVAGRVMG